MTRYLLGLILVLTLGLAACDADSTDEIDTTADPVIEQPIIEDANIEGITESFENLSDDEILEPLVPDDEPLPGSPASPTTPSN